MIENVFSAHRSDNTARDVTIQEKNVDGNATPISYDMGNSKSNTKISVATKRFSLRHPRYDMSANVCGLADNSGDDSFCLGRHFTLENLTSGMYIFCLAVNRVNGKCQVMI